MAEPAIIGHEAVGRVFRRDPALQGIAVRDELRLVAQADRRIGKLAGPAAIRIWLLDDVVAGDLFRHRMFDLNARIHLDEIKFACIGIDEKLDRAGVVDAAPLGQLSPRRRGCLAGWSRRDSAPARFPRPSGAGAGSSNRARRDERARRAGRRATALRCAGPAECSFSRKTSATPNAAPASRRA